MVMTLSCEKPYRQAAQILSISSPFSPLSSSSQPPLLSSSSGRPNLVARMEELRGAWAAHKYSIPEVQGPSRGPTFSYRPFGLLDFVLRGLSALTQLSNTVGGEIQKITRKSKKFNQNPKISPTNPQPKKKKIQIFFQIFFRIVFGCFFSEFCVEFVSWEIFVRICCRFFSSDFVQFFFGFYCLLIHSDFLKML